MTNANEPVKTFISYTHRDSNFKDQLVAHLSTLIRQKYITLWYDNQILPGELIDEKVSQALEECQIILLLISSDYLNSYYCYEIELMKALERREKGEVEVIPIMIRTADLTGTPFDNLKSLPTDRKPVNSYHDKDKAYTEIAKGIRLATENILKSRMSHSANKSDLDSQKNTQAGSGSNVTGNNYGFQFNGNVTINNSTLKIDKT